MVEHAGGPRTVPLPVAIVAPLLAAAAMVLVALVLTGALGPGERAAEAGGQNRAAVIVDTGSSVRAACVLFGESSITGAEALQRAGMSPVFQGFSGLGGAVCALNGVGCPSDGSCLTCQAPSYWQYWRSSGGGFSYSGAGAGSTQVTDGSIEGWSWGGTRSAPPLRSVDDVCGPEAPPPTSPPSTAPPSSGGGGGTGGGAVAGGGSAGGGSSGGPAPAAEASTTTTVADEQATTTTEADQGDDDAADEADRVGGGTGGDDEAAGSLITEVDDGGGNVVRSVVLTTGVLGAIGFFVWRARRRTSAEDLAALATIDEPGAAPPDDPHTGPGGG